MYVYGIKIARNYTITPDDAGMPPSNTTNIKGSSANISLRLVCKQIKFIKGGWLVVNTNMPCVVLVGYKDVAFFPPAEVNTMQFNTMSFDLKHSRWSYIKARWCIALIIIGFN